MEQLIMLGTGSAMVTKCYNACFAIRRDDDYLLVDSGGGNGILRQLSCAGIDLKQIHHIYVSHEHCDHMLGMIWIIRAIGAMIRREEYEGDLYIYGHSELMERLRSVAGLTLSKRYTWLFDNRIKFMPLYKDDRMNIMGYNMTFFDIGSTDVRQYGFTTVLANGRKLTFTGDEPLREFCYHYAQGSDWMIHEAYCLYSERDRYNPHDKGHGTVKESCELASYLGIPNLVLWHTEDDNISRRKALYGGEGRLYYYGNLYIPDDLEVIDLDN